MRLIGDTLRPLGLIIRMKAIVDSPRHIRFESFELDLRTCELRKDGSPVKLQGQPMQILVMLLERPGEIVTREELQKTLWPNDTFVEFDHSINAAIKRLRHALGDSTESPKYIETLARRGYRFIWPIDVTGTTAEPDRAVKETQVSAGASPKPKNYRLLVSVAAIVAILAVLLGLNVGGWREKLRPRASGSHIDSLAVLPLENLSRDPDQEYFADGITEAVISDLGKIGALRVISRQSVMHFKGSKETLPQIARALNVDAIVEGTVEHSGNRVVVSVDLIQASPEKHLWGEQYAREVKDILVLQNELAQSIAGEIRIRVTPAEKARLTSARALDPEAYDGDLKGRYFLSKRNPEGFKKAIEYFNRAVEKDPTYADPYAMLAQTYFLAANFGALPPTEALPKGSAAALKAISLDDSFSEAHVDAAWVAQQAWRWDEADREFARAIELNPNYAYGRSAYSYYLSSMGRFDEAIEQARRAESLDPLSPLFSNGVGSRLYWARRYDEAIAQCQKALELEPNFATANYDLARAYEQKGMLPQAIAEAERAVQLFGRTPLFLGALGHAYAISGRRTEALNIVQELLRPPLQRLGPQMSLATIYTGLGNKDQAFEQLEMAYREHSAWLVLIYMDPVFDPLRRDPRFADLIRRLELPPVH